MLKVKVRVLQPYLDDYGLHRKGDVLEVAPDYITGGLHEVLEDSAAGSADAEAQPEEKPAKNTTAKKATRRKA